jgi:hypothetical protein
LALGPKVLNLKNKKLGLVGWSVNKMGGGKGRKKQHLILSNREKELTRSTWAVGNWLNQIVSSL